jgi:uncharacterized iron-regulated membrane protein
MKSKRPRHIIFIAHRYIGLAIGILAAAIGLTGSLLIIHGWTSSLLTPRVTVTPVGDRLPLSKLIEIAKQAQPKVTLESLEIPQKLTEPITAWWVTAGDQWISAVFNPYTGTPLSSPKIDGESYTSMLLDIHINLMSGQWGYRLAGVVGSLVTLLCITGIILWPGWRKLIAGFKIKWNASIKRLNFDLHKVVGIIAAIFLSMAMFTGFCWNFMEWTYPIIYAMTFSSQPKQTADPEPISTSVADQAPLLITDNLLQTAIAAMPKGEITALHLPTEPTGVIKVTKTLPNQTSVTAILDQFSGKVLKVDGLGVGKPKPSLGDFITEAFYPIHFGTFAGEASRILYVFVGLSPTILLITGFIMWRERKKPHKPDSAPSRELTLQ